MTGPPSLAGVSHRYVEANGVRLHVAEAGEGPPLLLLHGWPQHWWSWRHLIPTLAERYHVLAPDLRGMGWSEAPPGDYAKATWCADIVALLDAEGLDRVRVIGHDWGGYTGFLLALGHPERVERFVGLDISPPWTGRFQARGLGYPLFAWYQVLMASRRLGPRVLTRNKRFIRTLIRLGGPGVSWRDEDLDAYAEVLRQPARAAASSAIYRTFLRRELPAFIGRDRSDELLVPTLLLMGGRSPLRLVAQPRAAPNMRVETIPGVGHFLPEEAPEEVLARAVPFLGPSG